MPDRKPAKKTIPFHEVANLFPMMSREEFAALQADIKANDLREPIWTYQGKIIDGRNRYQACLNLGIEPQFREWDEQGDLVAFVVSQNLHRRHLDSSQKSVLALEIEKQLSKAAKVNMRAGGGDKKSGNAKSGLPKLENPIRAAEQAAALVGTSRSYVSQAKKVEREVPALLDTVRVGALSVTDAAAVASLPSDMRAGVVDGMKSKPSREEKRGVVRSAVREAERRIKPKTQFSKARELAEWIRDARQKLFRLKGESFSNGSLIGWTDKDREMVLEAVDFLADDLSTFRNELLGGYTYDEYAEEGLEGAIN